MIEASRNQKEKDLKETKLKYQELVDKDNKLMLEKEELSKLYKNA